MGKVEFSERGQNVFNISSFIWLNTKNLSRMPMFPAKILIAGLPMKDLRATHLPPQKKQVCFGSKPLQWAGLACSRNNVY
jgi:hypothetical protein